MSIQIKKAERKAVKIKLAITGPSGAGKTMGSLLLAKGLANGGKVLVIDTEDGSSNLYADHRLVGMDFDVIEIDAPYTVNKYLEALQAGQEAGYEVIVIDSLSHAWEGEGGLLDKKSGLDSRGGNSYTNWAGITKEHNLFKARIVHSPCHVVVTMRSKQDYIMEANEKGKQMPKKVGLAPVQRDGMEYEFTTVFDVGMDHQFCVSKDRTALFDGRIEKITEKTGVEIRNWLSTGKEIKEEIIKNKHDLANTLATIHADDDKLSAIEFWKELSNPEKEAVKPLLESNVKVWLRNIVTGQSAVAQ